MSAAANSIDTGSVIDGFELGEMIHVGSMASIFRLTGPHGLLPLIMKIPRLGPGERAVNVISFEVCRMVLGALSQSRHHPTLVAYGDVETTPYLVMEFIDGRRLSEWIESAPLQTDEIVRLGAALAVALTDLHRQGVAHLDLKPTNVMYRADGVAVLIDFGLSHHSHYPDLLAEELRYPLGNWVYMAPEQVVGVRCDPRSDIFAMGAILYELATGSLPFGRPDTIAELRSRTHREPTPPRRLNPAIPAWLQEMILRCLEVDARDRYASAENVAHDFADPSRIALTDRGARLQQSRWWTRLGRRIRAKRFEPAPCPPPSDPAPATRVAAVAISPHAVDETLLAALSAAARQIAVADPICRIACVMVVPPAATLSGVGTENSATGRHIQRLVELRRWAKPLDLPEERLTFHVLESDKPAQALIDFVKMNDVDQVLIGPPAARFPMRYIGVCLPIVSDAPCMVTVVRPRIVE